MRAAVISKNKNRLKKINNAHKLHLLINCSGEKLSSAASHVQSWRINPGSSIHAREIPPRRL